MQEVREESIAPAESAETTENQSTLEHAAQRASSTISNIAQNASSAAASATSAATSAFGRDRPQRSGPERGQEAQPGKVLYVGNLFFEVKPESLEKEFGKYGTVTNCRIVQDGNGLSKGFGYVEFQDQQAADQAIKNLDQVIFEGRRLAVQYHVRRQPRTMSQPQAPGQPTKTLFIGNMSFQMSDKDLNDLFREIRNVLDVRVAIDRRTGQPRGFAHADFIDVASAEKAKATLESKEVYGRKLRVDFSHSANSRSQM
ncbi:hypothetical protein LTR66_007730 [Elasticomyces elasticus]|nr:hypothetical protein LTR66_007730 [Elasticomyces elasticus]